MEYGLLLPGGELGIIALRVEVGVAIWSTLGYFN